MNLLTFPEQKDFIYLFLSLQKYCQQKKNIFLGIKCYINQMNDIYEQTHL